MGLDNKISFISGFTFTTLSTDSDGFTLGTAAEFNIDTASYVYFAVA
jgi:hypothetical protein